MNRIPEWTWWLEARAIAARLARRGSPDDADDLAQDLAVRALEDGGTAATRPGAWLERVARNQVIDRWRVEQRRGELAPGMEEPPAPRDPEAHLLARERRRAVRRALLALPRDQRQAALLRYHGDLPYDAVAARLGTEAATARTRVHRALERVRARISGLRVLFVGWQGAQATALGLALAGATGIAPVTPGPAQVPQPAVALPAGRQLVAGVRRAPLAVAQAAPAATGARAPARHAPRRDQAPQPERWVRQEIRFGDDLIEGDVTGPEGERLVVVRPSPQPSLIEIRQDFLPEMVKALEDI